MVLASSNAASIHEWTEVLCLFNQQSAVLLTTMPPKKLQKGQQNTLLAMWSKPKNVRSTVEENIDDHALTVTDDPKNVPKVVESEGSKLTSNDNNEDPNTSTVVVSCDDKSEANKQTDMNNRDPKVDAKGPKEQVNISKLETSKGLCAGVGKKKKYKFQEKWRIGNQWLRYNVKDDLMYCTVCREFDKSNKPSAFVDGCRSIRWSNVVAHKASEQHERSVEAANAKKLNPKERPIEKQLTKLTSEQIEKMKKYVRTSFYIAQFSKPFNEFKSLMELQLANFGKTGEGTMYKTYMNDKSCKTFIDCIAADLLESKVVSALNPDCFISILADGSTDRSNTEQQIIYVTMLQNNKPVTQFVTLTNVPKANAENIATALKKTLTKKLKLSDWKNNVVSCCFDGAAVMHGERSGVATRLRKDADHLIAIHCCAHRFELAIKDMQKKMPEIDDMETVMKESYKFYKYSRENWDKLQSTGDILKCNVRKPVKVDGTRWIDHHHRALSVVSNNWRPMVVHMEDVKNNTANNKQKREQATEILDMLRSLVFILMMNFLLTYYAIMKELSLWLQRNDTTVDSVTDKVEAVKIKLSKMDRKALEDIISKDITEEFTEEMSTIKFREEEVGYKSQQMRETRSGQAQQSLSLQDVKEEVLEKVEAIVNETKENIDTRFDTFSNNPVLKASRVINPHNWPESEAALYDYGDQEIEELFKHFESLLQSRHLADLNRCKLQWIELKLLISRRRKLEIHSKKKQTKEEESKCSKKDQSASPSFLKFHEMWATILCDSELAEKFDVILAIVKILMVIPVHTSELERGFSHMNIIKSQKRSSLQEESLNSLMTVKLSKVDYLQYDPMGAIIRWSPLTLPKKRKRRTEIQPYGPRKVPKPDVNVDSDTAQDQEPVKETDQETAATAQPRDQEPRAQISESDAATAQPRDQEPRAQISESDDSDSEIDLREYDPDLRAWSSHSSDSDNDSDLEAAACSRSGGGLAKLYAHEHEEHEAYEGAWDSGSDSDF